MIKVSLPCSGNGSASSASPADDITAPPSQATTLGAYGGGNPC